MTGWETKYSSGCVSKGGVFSLRTFREIKKQFLQHTSELCTALPFPHSLAHVSNGIADVTYYHKDQQQEVKGRLILLMVSMCVGLCMHVEIICSCCAERIMFILAPLEHLHNLCHQLDQAIDSVS